MCVLNTNSASCGMLYCCVLIKISASNHVFCFHRIRRHAWAVGGVQRNGRYFHPVPPRTPPDCFNHWYNFIKVVFGESLLEFVLEYILILLFFHSIHFFYL
jgi:hypothetical protein